MHISSSSILGVVFLVLAFAATYTMFQFWGYDYDKDAKKSSCPQWKMNIHRAIGVGYIAVYVLMMIEMIPRMWEYQVEFPTRTVAHILLGSFIGIVLIIKVSILRFFRHFEEWMPVLGVSLLIASVLLGTMSLPAFFRERALAQGAVGGGVYSAANRDRVARLLPEAGFPDGVNLHELASEDSLEAGRHVLLDKCVMCHDLKTVITKPRTPADWVRTSVRMVEKPSLAGILSYDEGYKAAAYLIAITPTLQKSAKAKRQAQMDNDEAQRAADEVLVQAEGAVDGMSDDEASASDDEQPAVKDEPDESEATESETRTEVAVPKRKRPRFDVDKAKTLFAEECSLCHDISDTEDAPPRSRRAVDELLSRMIDNGLDLDKRQLEMIRFYLIETYVKKP